MMMDKFGNYVIQKAIEVSDEKQRDELVMKIRDVYPLMKRQNDYCKVQCLICEAKHVFNFLEKTVPVGQKATASRLIMTPPIESR
jgi:hypothetical protein